MASSAAVAGLAVSREIGFIDLLKQFTIVTSLKFIYLCFTARLLDHSLLATFINVAIKPGHKTYIV